MVSNPSVVKNEIETLKGGTLLHYDCKKGFGGLRLETYYEIKRFFNQPNPNYPKTDEEFQSLESDKGLQYYVDGFRDLLEKSIDDELISDVPLAPPF